MYNIKCDVQYDGSNYHGWQRQPNIKLTIQHQIESALKKIYKTKINILSAGRTDAGVHAYKNIFNYFAPFRIPLNNLKKAINSILPDDILIINLKNVDSDFHSRYSAVERVYLYKIKYNYFNPFIRNYFLFLRHKPNIDLIKNAAEILIGKHDFSAFRSSQCNSKTPIKILKEIIIKDLPKNEINIFFSANAFLHNMIRIMVGTLLDIGFNRIKPEDLKKILDSKNRRLASKTISPKGLYLLDVKYKEKN